MNPLAIILAALIGLYTAFGLRRHPRAALVVWLACIIAVPVWPELRIGASLQPLSVLAVCLLPAVFTHWRGPLKLGDWIMISFAATSTIAWVGFDAPQFAWVAVFTQWTAAYLIGRSLGPAAGAEWVTKAIAIAGSVVGTWALLEFAFSLHVFEQWFVALDTAGWHTVQIRGSYARSEGAFGHSIAMGGFLALCVPFVIASKIRLVVRVLMLAIVVGGSLVTFSRGAILGVAIAVILSLLFLSGAAISRRSRVALVLLTTAVSAVAVPWTLSLFDSVSSDLTVSSDYRQDLALSFVPDLHALGLGDGIQILDGRQFYRQFTSIDNAYALMGLQLGWLPVAILCLGLIGAAVRMMRRQGGPADVTLVSQAVVLATVALITQYGLAVFFIAGLASGMGAIRRHGDERGIGLGHRVHRPTATPVVGQVQGEMRSEAATVRSAP